MNKYILSQLTLLLVVFLLYIKQFREIDILNKKIVLLEKIIITIPETSEAPLISKNDYYMYLFVTVLVVFMCIFLNGKEGPPDGGMDIAPDMEKTIKPFLNEIPEIILNPNILDAVDKMATNEQFKELYDIFNN